MMHHFKKCSNPGLGLLFIRLALGIIFLVHGIAKLSDIAGTAMFFDMALPVGAGLAVALAWIVAIIETAGGIAVILGICARKAAWLLAIIMVVAIAFVKSKMPFAAAEIDLMLLAASLGIALAGPGSASLGRLMHRHHHDGVCDNCDICKDGCTNHEHTH